MSYTRRLLIFQIWLTLRPSGEMNIVPLQSIIIFIVQVPILSIIANPEIRPTQSFVVPMTHQPTNNSKFDYSNRFSFRHNASEIFLNAADFKKDLQRLQINLVKVQTENTVLRQQIDTYTTSFHRIRQEALMSRQRV